MLERTAELSVACASLLHQPFLVFPTLHKYKTRFCCHNFVVTNLTTLFSLILYHFVNLKAKIMLKQQNRPPKTRCAFIENVLHPLIATAVQARETFQGLARLEATDSLYSADCIMLTCTLEADASSPEAADTWRAVTLRMTGAYPTEPPSVVVRMSRDVQLAPQVPKIASMPPILPPLSPPTALLRSLLLASHTLSQHVALCFIIAYLT